MTTDYRALCAELLQAWDDLPWEYDWKGNPVGPLAEIDDTPFERARTALSQPEPVGVKPAPDYDRVPEIATEAQIRAAAQYLIKKQGCDGDLIPAIRYSIARWGRPTITPIPLSERLPGPEDWDGEGRCWMLGKIESDWRLISVTNPGIPKLSYCFSHWLPAHALPLPSPSDHH
jgi:hypothetical protein